MDSVKVKLIIGVEYRGRKHPAGAELAVPALDANRMISRGTAERVREVVRPKPEAKSAVEAAQ